MPAHAVFHRQLTRLPNVTVQACASLVSDGSNATLEELNSVVDLGFGSATWEGADAAGAPAPHLRYTDPRPEWPYPSAGSWIGCLESRYLAPGFHDQRGSRYLAPVV